MKDDKEVVGKLLGFDDFVNMVLEDVTEYQIGADGKRVQHKLDRILLNGNNVCMVSMSMNYICVYISEACTGRRGASILVINIVIVTL